VQGDDVEPRQVPLQQLGEILLEEVDVGQFPGPGGLGRPPDVLAVEVHPVEAAARIGRGVEVQAQPGAAAQFAVAEAPGQVGAGEAVQGGQVVHEPRAEAIVEIINIFGIAEIALAHASYSGPGRQSIGQYEI